MFYKMNSHYREDNYIENIENRNIFIYLKTLIGINIFILGIQIFFIISVITNYNYMKEKINSIDSIIYIGDSISDNFDSKEDTSLFIKKLVIIVDNICNYMKC